MRRTWLEINNGADPELRFELPKEVSPFHTTAGRLMVTLRAPGRTFEAFGYQNGQAVSLGRHDGPAGTVVLRVARWLGVISPAPMQRGHGLVHHL